MSANHDRSPVSPAPPLPAYAEIANLEHELGFLRERHANLLRNARRNRQIAIYGFWLTLGVLVAGFAYAIATDNGDATAKVFLMLMLVAVMGVVGWLCKDKDWSLTSYESSYPFRNRGEFLQHAIAVREKRLKELKRQS